MGVCYECVYCGKESPEEPLVFEGKPKDLMIFINKKNAKWSDKCDCRNGLRVVCKGVIFGDELTVGKEYGVGEVDTLSREYWVEDDNEMYNPYPQELFQDVKCELCGSTRDVRKAGNSTNWCKKCVDAGLKEASELMKEE